MKNRKLLFQIIPLFFLKLSFAQQQDFYDKHALFKEGIYLENLKTTIPWNADVSELTVYGNPKITVVSKKSLNVLWDSVTILNGINASLKYNPHRLSNGTYSRLSSVYAWIDKVDIERAIEFITLSSKVKPLIKTQRGMEKYVWSFDNCLVELSRGVNGGIINIQRSEALH